MGWSQTAISLSISSLRDGGLLYAGRFDAYGKGEIMEDSEDF